MVALDKQDNEQRLLQVYSDDDGVWVSESRWGKNYGVLLNWEEAFARLLDPVSSDRPDDIFVTHPENHTLEDPQHHNETTRRRRLRSDFSFISCYREPFDRGRVFESPPLPSSTRASLLHTS